MCTADAPVCDSNFWTVKICFNTPLEHMPELLALKKKHTVVGDWRITEGVCDTGACWKQLGDTVNFKTCGRWTFPE